MVRGRNSSDVTIRHKKKSNTTLLERGGGAVLGRDWRKWWGGEKREDHGYSTWTSEGWCILRQFVIFSCLLFLSFLLSSPSFYVLLFCTSLNFSFLLCLLLVFVCPYLIFLLFPSFVPILLSAFASAATSSTPPPPPDPTSNSLQNYPSFISV